MDVDHARLAMPIGEAMFTQLSIRRLRPDSIPLDDLRLVLEAAAKAPSGGNSQPARFLDQPGHAGAVGRLRRPHHGLFMVATPWWSSGRVQWAGSDGRPARPANAQVWQWRVPRRQGARRIADKTPGARTVGDELSA